MEATLRKRVKARPAVLTAVLSVVGYALVVGAFMQVIPLFPPLDRATVLLFGHLIAVINATALVSIIAGVWFIRRGQVRRHRAAMITAFALITLFLVLYLWKVGGGFEKSITATGVPRLAYLVMLGIHIFLSTVSVPVVLHAIILGLTHTPAELRQTRHAQVGRIAVVAWTLSLALGLVTYVMLNHVYGWEPRTELLVLVAVPVQQRIGGLRDRVRVVSISSLRSRR